MFKGGEKVLEIGAGFGYAAAVLSEIAANVYTVERLGPLAEKAAATLADFGYDNIHVLHGDGTRGWPAHAPYDAIVVAAGGPQEQLKIGGRRKPRTMATSQVFGILRDLVTVHKKTVVAVTHDLEPASQMHRRINVVSMAG